MTKRLEQLRELIAQGLTVSECIKVFAEKNDRDAELYIELAREQYHQEGEVEIDDVTITSGSSGDGDYVLAWVWVDDPNAEDEDEDEEIPL